MRLTGAVEWWEEWQLRILVLGSLLVQWLLFLSAALRKYAIPSWFRSIIWLAYQGSDALAIYALATLFSRQRRQYCTTSSEAEQGNSILEVVWAPVLLMHLGGQDLITAYNIEDNELWTRHVLTAVSQVTVAIYVFCKSWPGGDKRMLQASILFFVPGILKCIEKPWALKSASINSLVSSSSGPAPRRTADIQGSRINSLEDYVHKARAFAVQVQVDPCHQARDGNVDLEADNHPPDQAQGEDDVVELEPNHQPQTSTTWRSRLINQIKGASRSLKNQETRSQLEGYNEDLEAYKLFVDLASPYSDRLGILKSFWVLDEKQAYALLQNRLFGTFDLLYTKEKMLAAFEERRKVEPSLLELLSGYIRLSATLLPWAAIALFHKSHREAYSGNDVNVTYALFCCTAVLELACFYTNISSMDPSEANLGRLISDIIKQMVTKWQQATVSQLRFFQHKQQPAEKMELEHGFVGQYALIGFFVHNKKHTKTKYVLSFFNCKDFFDQHWSMKPCSSSFPITELVLKYVKKGWQDQIEDADSYWKFNDRRGQWTLEANKCHRSLGSSLRSPFDESVLLWHMATDFCFYYKGAPADHQCATAQCVVEVASGEGHGCAVWCERSPHHTRAIQCREMSNYMIYLLFVKPEMLLPGTRRNLLMTANTELEEILKDDSPLLKKILKGDKPWLMEILKCNKPFLEFFTGTKPLHEEIERGFTQRIISKLQHTGSPPEAERYATTREGFIHDAWKLASALLDIGDENKMWEVIEGVWVEMLCFSASRCRGYLHAKSLGAGGELLTYIWLLLSHMGMETLSERLQRTDLSSGELPSTS